MPEEDRETVDEVRSASDGRMPRLGLADGITQVGKRLFGGHSNFLASDWRTLFQWNCSPTPSYRRVEKELKELRIHCILFTNTLVEIARIDRENSTDWIVIVLSTGDRLSLLESFRELFVTLPKLSGPSNATNSITMLAALYQSHPIVNN